MKLSRRSFLKCTGLTALAVATASVTTGCSPLPLWMPEFKGEGEEPATVGGVTVKAQPFLGQGDGWFSVPLQVTGQGVENIQMSNFSVVDGTKSFDLHSVEKSEDYVTVKVKGTLPANTFYVRFSNGGKKIYYKFTKSGSSWTVTKTDVMNVGLLDWMGF